MVLLDRTVSIPYAVPAMSKRHRRSHRGGLVGLVATILVLVLPLCLVAGTMAYQDSCQDLGSPPDLCSKATSQADHLVAAPASVITPLPSLGISEILFQYVSPTTPCFGFLSTPDGRAPPSA